jgi:glycosyltransferase involved in cell wall biosynthesis
MNAASLKVAIQGSPLLLTWYGYTLTVRAQWAAVRGNEHDALHHLLRAHRIVPASLLPYRGRAALRTLLTNQGLTGEATRPITENRVLAAFARSEEAEHLRRSWAEYPLHNRLRLRHPRTPDDPERQGNLIILKDKRPAENGVLLVKYNNAMRQLPAIFDLQRLLHDYTVVLEPSSGGYHDTTFLLYAGSDVQVLVQSPRREDHDFIASLENGLVPVRTGAGDWVDPAVFRPRGAERRFGVTMVSMWDPLKRHHVLFRALKDLRRAGTEVTAALIGYPGRWQMGHVRALAESFDVADLCTFFESIPHEQVAEILAQSYAYVLLSRREGANKSLYESLFSDTPVIVPAGHVGINLDHVTDETGLTFNEDRELADRVKFVITNAHRFRPREWALKNTGAIRSTAVINAVLRDMAERHGAPWSRDIVVKVNAPNLRYQDRRDRLDLEPAYDSLARYLRG